MPPLPAFLATLVVTLSPARHESAWPAAPPEPRFASACDVVFLDTRTIVVADWDGNAQVSLDGGATWEAHPMHTWTRDLTFDRQGNVLSLYYWRGIHEASQAEIVTSRDRGITWTATTWPADRPLPVDFVSQPGDEVVLLDEAGQCWRHADPDDDAFTSWRPLGVPVPPRDGRCGLRRGNLLYVATGEEVWLSKDAGTTWRLTSAWFRVCALESMPESGPDQAERLAAATDAGEIYTVELGKRSWKKLGSFPVPHHVNGIAATSSGIWVAGEELHGDGYGGRVDPSGHWQSLEGLPPGQSIAIRRATDGRVWIASGGLYAVGEGSKRWERVWPR